VKKAIRQAIFAVYVNDQMQKGLDMLKTKVGSTA
jgi:hypothetical protein